MLSMKKNRHEKGIVLVSGGMDSAVCASIARVECEELFFLHIDYGQRTEVKERECFFNLCKFFGVTEYRILRMEHFKIFGGSSLVDTEMEVEKGDINRKEIPTSYVPFRNGNFLSIATSIAEVLSADAIYIGAVYEDSSGYPDCRPEFYKAFQRAIDLGTKPETKIKIETPVIYMKKSEIVKTGYSLGTPFEYTWSCYKSEDVACGECDSCLLRLRAFRDAGIKDPLPYKNNGGN